LILLRPSPSGAAPRDYARRLGLSGRILSHVVSPATGCPGQSGSSWGHDPPADVAGQRRRTEPLPPPDRIEGGAVPWARPGLLRPAGRFLSPMGQGPDRPGTRAARPKSDRPPGSSARMHAVGPG